MKTAHSRRLCAALLAALALAPVARAGDTTNTTSPGVSMAYTSGAVALSHPGQLLASNCFQCHGTNGYSSIEIAGKSARDILDTLSDMRGKTAGAHIMYLHAQGYTPEQLSLIADYFSSQPSR
mgnify:CR=1 FL=1